MSLGVAGRLEFADESFDLVFGQQVLEHMHREDVPEHLAEAFRVLSRGGTVAVETHNRRTGPQDISRGSVTTAEGLHLREWSVRELIVKFCRAGFIQERGLLAPSFLVHRSPTGHRLSRVPAATKLGQDWGVALIPGLRMRTLMAKLTGLDDIFLFGRKGPLKDSRE